MLFSVTMSLALASVSAVADGPKPNVVFMMTDDLGYGDLGCQGHPRIKTPRLDQMASEGVRLTSFYSGAPICSPSRAALFTGCNPNRVGVRDWIKADSGVHLPRQEVTVAQRLKEAGYATCLSGKWHLNSRFNGSEPTPGDFGFDHWFATQNNTAHQSPANYVRNGTPVGPLKKHDSTLVVDEALEFIKEKQGGPFAVFVTFHATHEQVGTPESYRALYSDLPDPTMRDYYGSVSLVDHEVGRLVDEIDRLGLGERTLIVFTSDNGPQKLLDYPKAIHSHGSAKPLRGYKLSMFEGGYRVPGIVRWKGRIKPGTECAEPIAFVDVLPTLCALAGVEPPRGKVLDGVNVLPLLDGKPVERPRALSWQFDYANDGPWRVAIRRGDWKLLADDKLEQFALYNLVEDLGETRERSADEPRRLEAMKAEIKRLYVPMPQKP